ncbi:hypothetical protein KI387_013049, partial [Taxus chinensis]
SAFIITVLMMFMTIRPAGRPIITEFHFVTLITAPLRLEGFDEGGGIGISPGMGCGSGGESASYAPYLDRFDR